MGCRLVVTALLLCACKAELGEAIDGGVAGDGPRVGTSDAPDGAVVLGAWSTPTIVPGAASSTISEDDCTLSADKLELYFKRSDAGNNNLYMMKRTTPMGTFDPPVALGILNSTGNEESPRLSPDDLTLYFGRAGNIYKSTRLLVGQPWGAPTEVTSLNTTANEKWAAVCGNDYVIVSRANGTNLQDLYEGTIAGGATMPIAAFNTNTNEQGTMLTTDCLRVYFQSSRTNNQFDIYMAQRATTGSAWSNPTAIADFNTGTFDEEDAWISADQRVFLFASTMIGGQKDVYISTR